MGFHRPAPMDRERTSVLNLQVLKQLDAATEEILASAGTVALYELDTSTKSWARKDVEGSLFFIRRTVAPFYQFTILNKKSQCNFHEVVHPAFEIEEQNDQYLLYSETGGKVRCMWFHSAAERANIAQQVREIVSCHLPAGKAQNSSHVYQGANGSPGGVLLAQLQKRHATDNTDSGALHELLSNFTPDMAALEAASLEILPLQQQQQNLIQFNTPNRSVSIDISAKKDGSIASSGHALQAQLSITGRTPSSGAPLAMPTPHSPATKCVSSSNIIVSPGSGVAPGLGMTTSVPVNAPTTLFSRSSASTGSSPIRPPLLTPSYFLQQQQQQELGKQPGLQATGAIPTGSSEAAEQQPNSSCLVPTDVQRGALRAALLLLCDEPTFMDMLYSAMRRSGAM